MPRKGAKQWPVEQMVRTIRSMAELAESRLATENKLHKAIRELNEVKIERVKLSLRVIELEKQLRMKGIK